MTGLDMNIVFNIKSIEELERLTGALKETATLQAKLHLEERIKSLISQRDELRAQITHLRQERDALRPHDTDKDDIEKKAYAEEMGMEPLALREDSNRIIDRLSEEEVVNPTDAPPE